MVKQRPSNNMAYKRITKEIYKVRSMLSEGNWAEISKFQLVGTLQGLCDARDILRESLNKP